VTAERSRVDERLDLIATILLALATVAVAWSGYQASRWNGEQAKAASRTTGIRILAARAQSLAQAQTEVDVATFSSWADAYARKEPVLADFYFKRFRAEFKPAVEAWIATRPLKNPAAPLTPFAMPEYKLKAQTEADKLDVQSAQSAAAVQRYIQRSTNYVLATVLFATTLFFAGMSTKLPTVRLRRILLGLGVVVFVATTAWIALSPVSVSI
jgi:hypothetical protein